MTERSTFLFSGSSNICLSVGSISTGALTLAVCVVTGGPRSASSLLLFRRRNQNIAPTTAISITPSATPIPIPTFAPLGKLPPPLLISVSVGGGE
ncbi:hypothetical protein BDV12DRAFT_180874 [Aspergillus spectabilis]